MSSIFVYLPDLSSSINAGAAALPNLLVEPETTDIVFKTSLDVSAVQGVFQFTKNGDDLYLHLTNTLRNNNLFEIVNATFDAEHSGAAIPYNALTSLQTGVDADGVATLSDDFLGYLAHSILGSQNLVGAFANSRDVGVEGEPTPIIGDWSTSVFSQIASAVITQRENINSSYYYIAGFENLGSPAYVNPTTSLLWDIYSAVLKQTPSRIINSTDNVLTDLFAEGDVFEIDVTITPALDETITLANGATSITTPSDRKYRVRVTLVSA